MTIDWPSLAAALLSCTAAAALFLAALRSRFAPALVLLLAMLPHLVLRLVNFDFQIASFHGFFHAAVVYRIANGAVPPDNPLLAQEPLSYPWAAHAFVALFVNALGVSPFTAFAALNTCSLLALLWVTQRLAGVMWGDRRGALFALVPLFGFSFFLRGPAAAALRSILDIPQLTTGEPLADKFASINLMPFGLVWFALAVQQTVFILRGAWRMPGQCLLLGLSLIFLGLFYPVLLLFFAIAVSGGACAAAFKMPAARPPALVVAGATGAAVLLLAPYLGPLVLARTSAALPHIGFPIKLLSQKAVVVCLTFVPFAALWCAARRFARDEDAGGPGDKDAGRLALRYAVLILIACYLSLRFPGVTYKFLYTAKYLSALFFGRYLALLSRRFPKVIAVLLILLFANTAFVFAHRARFLKGAVSSRYYPCATRLCSHDAQEEELHRWITTQTGPHDVFIDDSDEMLIPVMAQRSIYVMPRGRRRRGYAFDRAFFYRSTGGYEKESFRQRLRVQHALFAQQEPQPAAIFPVLQKSLPRHSGRILLVARRTKDRWAFERLPCTQMRFENVEAAVFEVQLTQCSSLGAGAPLQKTPESSESEK